MKWYKNLRISAKLISAFLIVSLIAVVIGVVGFININDIGKQKLIGVEELLRLQNSFTTLSELENVLISPNVSFEEKKNIYIENDAVYNSITSFQESYLALNLSDEERKMWDDVQVEMEHYFNSHDDFLSKSLELDTFQIENPPLLRYVIASRLKDHYKWIWMLEDSMLNETTFTGQLDGTQCALGLWLESYNTESTELLALIDEIEIYHLQVHSSGQRINDIILSNQENKLESMLSIYQNEILPNMTKVLSLLSDMDILAEKSEMIYLEITEQALGINQTNHSEAAEAIGNLVDYTTKEATNAVTSASLMIIIFTVIGTILAVGLGVLISNIIKKPIAELVILAESVADGDLTVENNINTKDEVGALGKAFKVMTNNMNQVMSNINAASDQVASGSRQLSDSSMSLSQGSTEQASSIEELTASIEEIASQTRANAINAEKAKEISNSAFKNGQIGNVQMSDMLTAMTEINDASNKISKIIKVIDDIAFQTNILALNAAVEAARAGQHGKGFAVVAEEVRNLAKRSADAAKETTNMIEGSMRKVSDGTKIANDTAKALEAIVNDVSEASDLVGAIAIASNEQALGVDQINQGITQISQVVQTTSATAEETAAASEELSSQADMLKSQVATFKIKSMKSNNDNINPDVLKMLEEMQHEKPSVGEKKQISLNKSSKKISLSDHEFDKY